MDVCIPTRDFNGVYHTFVTVRLEVNVSLSRTSKQHVNYLGAIHKVRHARDGREGFFVKL